DEGAFSSTSLAVGTYGLKAELSGFISFRHKNLEVKPGYRLELAITLHVGSVGGAALFTDDKDVTRPV
ncbi:MAG TPA: carboxypeptidase-like regulatory domain-containing protein, partial [Terriglobia bacterium]|nr:carboxypeptidase-like regulatory domain-containing protein [Terriglobia bacterium]